MAKVNIKFEKITPFGEIYYANKAFMRFHLTKSATALLVFAVIESRSLYSTLPPYAPNVLMLNTKKRCVKSQTKRAV